MGVTGNLDGDDIIDIILKKPVCANYIAGRLYRHFVSEECPPDLEAAMGDILRDANYELRPLLRTIFASRAFYQPSVIGSQIKGPVQLVVGTIRMLGLEMPRDRAISNALNQMGQVPLFPPNVKGWPGGRQWINTSTLFVRYNTAVWLTGGSSAFAPQNRRNRGRAVAQPVAFQSQIGGSPEQVVDQWVSRLIGRPIEPDKRQILIDALDGRADREENVRRMVQLIVSMPDYQLC
jgi:hypothetical protein